MFKVCYLFRGSYLHVKPTWGSERTSHVNSNKQLYYKNNGQQTLELNHVHVNMKIKALKKTPTISKLQLILFFQKTKKKHPFGLYYMS